jgi:hypothetical protein
LSDSVADPDGGPLDHGEPSAPGYVLRDLDLDREVPPDESTANSSVTARRRSLMTSYAFPSRITTLARSSACLRSLSTE